MGGNQESNLLRTQETNGCGMTWHDSDEKKKISTAMFSSTLNVGLESADNETPMEETLPTQAQSPAACVMC